MREEVSLSFEANTWQVWHRHVAINNFHSIREAAKGLEQVRVRLVTTQAQACSDVQGHLVPAMRMQRLGDQPCSFSMSKVRRYSTRP